MNTRGAAEPTRFPLQHRQDKGWEISRWPEARTVASSSQEETFLVALPPVCSRGLNGAWGLDGAAIILHPFLNATHAPTDAQPQLVAAVGRLRHGGRARGVLGGGDPDRGSARLKELLETRRN